jgi:hypothetical protein
MYTCAHVALFNWIIIPIPRLGVHTQTHTHTNIYIYILHVYIYMKYKMINVDYSDKRYNNAHALRIPVPSEVRLGYDLGCLL